MSNAAKKLVWDLPVRLFHWLLALAIGAQWYTGEQGEDWLTWHFYIGYFTLGLIVFRIVWGFTGTRYARFSQFFPTPQRLKHYFTLQQATVGHPPLGGLMIIFMLTLLLLQAVSGLFTTDDIFTDGPWRSVASKELQDTADWLHANLFSIIQMAVALHVLAAFYYLLVKKRDLITPMLTGKKNTDNDQAIAGSNLPLALIIAATIAVATYFLIVSAPVVDDYY